MSLSRLIAVIALAGLLSCGVGTTPTASAQASPKERSSTTIDEMTCGSFRVTAFADRQARAFGVLLREYDYGVGSKHPKLLRSFVFPETQAEFDFRVAPTSVYCELKEKTLLISGRGYDEGGYVVYRIRLDTASWKYDFSSVRQDDEPF